MPNLTTIKVLITNFCLLYTVIVYSQKPSTTPIVGEMAGSLDIGNCVISSITAKYRISTIVGEPSIFLNFKWKYSGTRGSDDCLRTFGFDVFIKIWSTATGSYYYLSADGALGNLPKGDNTWGYNPIAGSPDWEHLMIKDNLIINPNVNPNSSDKWNFVSANSAKAIWRQTMTISGIVFKSYDGREYYITK